MVMKLYDHHKLKKENKMLNKSVSEMVLEAKQSIENLTPDKVDEELAGNNVVLIDIRESEEATQNGQIPGSVLAPRGMLEFYADSTSNYYRPEFDMNKRIILYCASGGRSALAVASLKNMGYENVAHLDGGINAWKESGRKIV